MSGNGPSEHDPRSLPSPQLPSPTAVANLISASPFLQSAWIRRAHSWLMRTWARLVLEFRRVRSAPKRGCRATTPFDAAQDNADLSARGIGPRGTHAVMSSPTPVSTPSQNTLSVPLRVGGSLTVAEGGTDPLSGLRAGGGRALDLLGPMGTLSAR